MRENMNTSHMSFLYALLKNRVFLFKVLLVVMAVTVGVTFLLTKKYTVTTVILPPEEPASPGLSMGGMSIGDFAGFFSGGMGYSLPLMTTLSDVYVEILNSRTLIDNVIQSTGYADSCGANRHYSGNPEIALFQARKSFAKDYSAQVTSSGFIEIKMTTKDPLYSVLISERIVFLLDSINTSVTLARFQESRELTENQLLVAQAALESTTSRLESFEAQYGSFMPEEQLQEFMTVLTEMKGRYLETTLTANAIRNGIRYGTSAQVLELETQAMALSQAIYTIENGSTENSDVDLGPGLRNMPPAVIEYARLRTDFEMQLKMVTALQLQVEQALVQEQNITSSLRILDPPRHPGWKSGPKKLIIWVEVFIFTTLLLCAFVFSREKWYMLKEKDPEAWAKWDDLFKEMRSDLRRKKRK